MVKRTKLALAAVIGVAVACSGAVASAPRADALPSVSMRTGQPHSARISSSGLVLWGASFGGAQYGLGDAPWTMQTVSTFEREVGKSASLVHFMLPWYKCYTTCTPVPFPAHAMSLVRAAGKIPVLGWNSYSQPTRTLEPHFQLSDVIRGRYDPFIRSWARAARSWGHPFFLVLDREMNLNCCYPYVEGRNGNRPGQFVAMWRHVHRIFASVGATNATWVWAPNVAYDGSTPFGQLYPGRSYTNWTGLDGYNWGTSPQRRVGWRSFTKVFGASYGAITRTVAPRKPMMIVETASTESGGSKADWIANMLGSTLAKSFPRIRALTYYNHETGGMDWPIESSPAATAAFARAMRSPHYATGRYAHIAQSPIHPPA